jgi:hypothetical protein
MGIIALIAAITITPPSSAPVIRGCSFVRREIKIERTTSYLVVGNDMTGSIVRVVKGAPACMFRGESMLLVRTGVADRRVTLKWWRAADLLEVRQ